MMEDRNSTSVDLRALTYKRERRISVTQSNALDHFGVIESLLKNNKRLVLLLDYDGTLTPIVNDPAKALLSDEVRDLLNVLPQHYVTGIVSGRSLSKIRNFVGVPGLYYAGSHGFDILAPTPTPRSPDEEIQGPDMRHQVATEFLPALQEIKLELEQAIKSIPFAEIEDNVYSVSVHYRNCARSDLGKVQALVTSVKERHSWLRSRNGKEVYELQPDIRWNKGSAVMWVIEALGLKVHVKAANEPADDGEGVAHDEEGHRLRFDSDKEPNCEFFCIYIGDDVSDEDAFKVFSDNEEHAWQPGLGILVSEESKNSHAAYTLKNPAEVKELLKKLVGFGRAHNLSPIALNAHVTRPAEEVRVAAVSTEQACASEAEDTLSNSSLSQEAVVPLVTCQGD